MQFFTFAVVFLLKIRLSNDFELLLFWYLIYVMNNSLIIINYFIVNYYMGIEIFRIFFDGSIPT